MGQRTERWVDTANWAYGAGGPGTTPYTPKVLDALQRAGIDGIMVGLQYPTQHTVEPGDTLSAIAAAHGVDMARLLQLNTHITNADALEVGQVISIHYPAGNAHATLAAIDAWRAADPEHRMLDAAYMENHYLERVLEFVPRERLQRCERIAVAVEPDGGFIDEESIAAALAEADSIKPGVPAVLYGAQWAAEALGIADLEYPDRDGFAAHYDVTENLEAPSFLGVRRVIAKQWYNHYRIDGVPFEMDISLWSIDDEAGAPVEAPADPVENAPPLGGDEPPAAPENTPVTGGTLVLDVASNDEAMDNLRGAVNAMRTDGAQFIASVQGPGRVEHVVPDGYRLILAQERYEGAGS